MAGILHEDICIFIHTHTHTHTQSIDPSVFRAAFGYGKSHNALKNIII
jgi:hypothetical protein